VNGVIDEVTFNTAAATSAINNLLAYSQTYPNWNQGNITITNNALLAPDGTTTAARLIEDTTNIRHIINQGAAVAAGALQSPYTVSVYAKADTRGNIQLVLKEYQSFVRQASAIFNVSTGTIGTTVGFNGATLLYSNIANVGGGWYRCSVTVNLASNETQLGSEILIANTSSISSYLGDGASGLYIWGAQTEAGNVATVYQGVTTAKTLLAPAWATRTAPDTVYTTGQFDEVTYNSTTPTIKNLLWQTQNWTANIQFSANVSVTANSIQAPDGTQTGSTITTTVGGYNNDALIQKWNPTGIPTSALPYCLSVFVKQGNCPTVGLNLAFYNGTTYQDAILTLTWANLSISTAGGTNTGTLNYGVTNAGAGWYRLWCSATNNYSAVGVVGRIWVRSVYNNNVVGDSNYAWGMQIEQGSSPTSYQGIGATTLVTPNFARRDTSQGNVFVTSSLDEFTGAPVVDSSLQWWTDGAQTASYSGSGTGIRNLANTAQTGTISGNVTYSSVDGGKFVFSDYLDTTNTISAGNIGYPASVNDPWTMEAWIYVPTGATWSINNNVGPLYIRGSYSGAHGLVRMTADNTVAVWLRGNTTALAYRTGVTTRDRWNQVVGVWTGGAGGNLQCYVNGTLTQASTTTQDDPLKSTLFYAIGASNTGMSNNTGAVFVGSISNTKLYNRALSADEVAQNFNALRRRYNI
jgi:hypothetical protein